MFGQIIPTRLSRGLRFAFLLCLLTAGPAAAQGPFATRLLFGAVSPVGGLKDWYAAGGLAGVQASWSLNENFAATGTTYWANAASRRRDGHPSQAVGWNLDVGVEGHSPRFGFQNAKWDVKPFVGIGAGTRSYSFPTTVQGSTTGWGGYASLGADFWRHEGRFGLRTELRGYRASYTDVQQSIPRATGTDLVALLGLSIR
jgi:hypothetical protein